jgi:hypothetical protein
MKLSVRPTPCLHPVNGKKRRHFTNTHLKFAARTESWGNLIPLSWGKVLELLDHVAGTEEGVLEVCVGMKEVRLVDVRKEKHETGECEADVGGCLGAR